MTEISHQTAPDKYNLTPITDVDVSSPGLLVPWERVINAIGGNPVKLVGYAALLDRQSNTGPLSPHDIHRAISIAQGSEPLAKVGVSAAKRMVTTAVIQRLAHRVEDDKYAPTDLGARSLGAIGVFASWQCNNPDYTLGAVLGLRGPALYESNEPYAHRPMSGLRIAQLLLAAEKMSASELSKAVPGRSITGLGNDASSLVVAGLVRREATANRVNYSLLNYARQPLTHLLQRLGSLHDSTFHKAASDVARSLLSNQESARMYVGLSIRESASAPDRAPHDAPVLPSWFKQRVEDSSLPSAAKEAAYASTMQLLKDGVIRPVANGSHGFTFNAGLYTQFSRDELRAVARYFRLENIMYTDGLSPAKLEKSLGLRPDQTLKAYVEHALLGRLTQFARDTASKK